MLNYNQIDDRYDQGPRKKARGYPSGDSTRFLHGRIVRRYVCTCFAGGSIPMPVAATTDIISANFFIARGRAAYICMLHFFGNYNYRHNIDVQYQIFINGKRVISGSSSNILQPINVYVPSESRWRVYIRIINNEPVITGFLKASLEICEYDSFVDVWDYGTGAYLPNPNVWPLF